jgi:ribosomal-protein-alanine N-acetyltransferase
VTDSVRIRPVRSDDASALSAVYRANRRFLAPWEPIRDDAFFTAAGQRERLESARNSYPCVIEHDERIVGMISLSAIERGPAQTANLGYWVAEAMNGRGIATRAVRLMIDTAFGELGLHRLQAGTLVHNTGSQRVLEHNGFERIGVARSYLKIAGRWQDHILFQRLPNWTVRTRVP